MVITKVKYKCLTFSQWELGTETNKLKFKIGRFGKQTQNLWVNRSEC